MNTSMIAGYDGTIVEVRPWRPRVDDHYVTLNIGGSRHILTKAEARQLAYSLLAVASEE